MVHPSARLLAGGAAFPAKVEIKTPGFNVLSALGICDVSDKTTSVGLRPHARAAAGLLASWGNGRSRGFGRRHLQKALTPVERACGAGRSLPVLTHSLCHSLLFQLVRSPGRSKVSIPLC